MRWRLHPLAGSGQYPAGVAGVAEWQTRQTQNLLSERTWGFKSLHPHQLTMPHRAS